MEMIQHVIEWFKMHSGMLASILGVVVVIDHALAAIPSIASSSTFQLFSAGVEKLHNALLGKKPDSQIK